MKARIGFVLFLLVFLVTAIVLPLVERTAKIVQLSSQSFSVISGRFMDASRLLTKKVSLAQWRIFTSKAQ